MTSLKLVDKGFGEANMGLFAVIEFPAQILFAFQTGFGSFFFLFFFLFFFCFFFSKN